MIKLMDWDKTDELECPIWIERECRVREYARGLAERHKQSRREDMKEKLKAASVLCGFLAGLAMVCGVML